MDITYRRLGPNDTPSVPFEVVNPNSQRCVLEVTDDGKITFYSKVLEQQFRIHGVHLPEFLQQDFKNRKVIPYDDEDFTTAFLQGAWYNLRRAGYQIRSMPAQSSLTQQLKTLEIH